MGDTNRIHLAGRGHSGRAVRVRVLSSNEVDKVELLARGDTQEGSSILDFYAAVAKYGLQYMVVAYTDPISPERFEATKPGAPAVDAEGKPVPPLAWVSCGPADLDEKWGNLFTARDTGILKLIYKREHVVTEEDADLVMAGKVQETE